MRRLMLGLAFVIYSHAQTPSPRNMQLGVDADNWSGQIGNAQFEISLRKMKLDFISWHLSPEEENNPRRLSAIVDFCRRNHWSYLFNTEISNYVRDYPGFQHSDGTYRYDLAERTLSELKDDPLFLGVIYDEADLVQALCGTKDPKGKEIQPYFADTRKLTPSDAFLAVAAKIAELKQMYNRYGKRLIFEMTFPDYPFAFARGGALLAPKFLKENYDDLMYDVYRGAALEYKSTELWACVDLWFLDNFPFAGKAGPGFHTPAELLQSLKYAYSVGLDFVYVEQAKALMTETYALTPYADKVIEFQAWRVTHKQGDWRTGPIDYYVKRFPDGSWGQAFSGFLPDHPYGSFEANPYRQADERWLQTLHDLSHGTIPADANNWNATMHPQFKTRSYQAIAGLPAMVVFDQFGVIPPSSLAKVLDFIPGTPETSRSVAIH